MPVPFADRLAAAVDRCGAAAVVGIDPHLERLPMELGVAEALRAGHREAAARGLRTWSLGVLAALEGVVPVVKPQVAFFEALGSPGVAVLEEVVSTARSAGFLVVLDAKRGDIGSTAEAYARATLDPGAPMESDALTVAPYLGPTSLDPFVQRCDAGKGLFVLVRTSNPGSEDWQVKTGIAELVAKWIRDRNATRIGAAGMGPIGAVVAATLDDELPIWRRRMPGAWFLMPGVGAQGAAAGEVCAAVGAGALISASRSVLFGSPAERDWRGAVHDRARRFAAEIAAASA